jgi:hypothetical protein
MVRGPSIALIVPAVGYLVAACTAAPQAVTPQATAANTPSIASITPVTEPIGSHCPPRGTVAKYSDGTVVTYLGVDPAASDICIGRNNAGNPVQRIRGIWVIGGLWPDSIAGVRDAMMKLTTMAPGSDVAVMSPARAAIEKILGRGHGRIR